MPSAKKARAGRGRKAGRFMLCHYGYQDASGDFFITIDTGKCDGCGDCVTACPAGIFAVMDEDPNDPMRDEPVAVVAEEKRKKLKYECSACKPAPGASLPCVKACRGGAISHAW